MGTRRGRGEGGLYQRHDHPTCPPLQDGPPDKHGKPTRIRPTHRCKGRWVKTIDLGWSNGTRTRKVLYGTTKGEVLDKETALRKTGRDELPTTAHTVETWINYWHDKIAPDRCRPQTLAGYRSKIDAYIVPLIGRHRLDKLEPRHLREMYERMGEQCGPLKREEKCPHKPSHGLSNATRRQTHMIVRRALTIAMRERLVTENVATLIDAPSTQRARRDRLTGSEAKLVLAKADATDAGYAVRWWLGLHQAMRRGEVLGLPWVMVNFDDDTITIARVLVLVNGKLSFGDPKSETSKRTIPMTPHVRARLVVHWARYVARCKTAGVEPDLSSLVFCQDNGKPIWPKTDWNRWAALLQSAGVRHVSVHSQRNTTAELLEDAGVAPRLAMEILGHSSESQTFDYQRGRNLDTHRVAMQALAESWDRADDEDD